MFTRVLTALLFIAPLSAANAMSLQQVIDLAFKNSERLQAIDKNLTSLEREIEARDLVLSPRLTSELALFNDHTENLFGTTTGQRNTSGLFEFTLTKPFSTGTDVSVGFSQQALKSPAFTDERNISSWEARITQSLWRDGFGRSTRLRRKAEANELLNRRYNNLLQKQRLVNDIEHAYWDLLFAAREKTMRDENVKRSESLERWIRRRAGKFAAETSDVLQVQSLLRQRELDLTAAENRLEAARARLKQYIPNIEPATWQLDQKALELDRDYKQMTSGTMISGQPLRIDALAAQYGSQQARFESQQIRDSLRPELDVYVAYGSNGIDPKMSESLDRAGSAKYDAGRVGLLLTVELDSKLKESRRQSADLSAQAQAAEAQGLQRESELGWSELERTIKSLQAQVKNAQALYEVQQKKAKAERQRYEYGRTTALQLTLFEVDAAESELRYHRLLTELRKLESSARYYAYDSGASQ